MKTALSPPRSHAFVTYIQYTELTSRRSVFCRYSVWEARHYINITNTKAMRSLQQYSTGAFHIINLAVQIASLFYRLGVDYLSLNSVSFPNIY